MKNKKAMAVIIVASIVAAGAALLFLSDKRQAGYVYLDGTVTAYDVTPSYSDGGIIFRIDSQSVDIGGGLRPQQTESSKGDVYYPIHIGDQVTAKLHRTDSGYLTVYDCKECYVHKK